MKKILKTILSAATVLAVSATSLMAAPIDGEGKAAGGNSVTIPKNIAVYNDGYGKSYMPAVDYTFSITPKAVTSNDKVTDSNGNSALAKAGIADALDSETATVSFAGGEIVAADNGDDLNDQVEGDFTITFDPSEFDAPGIYRYVIEDTTDDDYLIARGITRVADYDTTRDLDVYVKFEGGSPVIDGYVLSNTTDGTIEAATEKDPGYIIPGDTTEVEFPGQPGGPGDPNAAPEDALVGIDYYRTYNVTVTKTITGNMSDATNEFPFSFALTNSNTNAVVPANVYAGEAGAVADTNASTLSGALKNADVYYIYGLNPYAVVTATETNNTTQTYIATSTDGAKTDFQVQMNETATFGANAVSNYDGSTVETAGANNDLGVTNTSDTPEITGMVMTVLPFVGVAVVAAALFALVLIRKNKKNASNENA